MTLKQNLDMLPAMAVKDLRLKYAEVFNEPTNAHNKDWLVKRIAWRLQAQNEGGLSERAKQRAKELANEADLRVLAPASTPTTLCHNREPRSETASAGGHHHPHLQRTYLQRRGSGQRLQLERLHLQDADCCGRSHHRHAPQRLPLLRP